MIKSNKLSSKLGIKQTDRQTQFRLTVCVVSIQQIIILGLGILFMAKFSFDFRFHNQVLIDH